MIVIENKRFSLMLGDDCRVKSLICKSTGAECIKNDEDISLFSLTEERPYNNEIKLAHPNKRTTFEADRVRREGNHLIIGFELVAFEAVVEIKEEDDYAAFTLVDFIIHPEDFAGLAMTPPPVCEFRLLQLPVLKREKFGEWLNVMWDENAAINVLSTSPYAVIDSEKKKDYRIMYADARKNIKLIGCGAALIVATPDELLDCIDVLEKDYGLPRGVMSRRSEYINASVYWTSNLSPENVDEHIYYAHKGGFRMMLIYYTSFFKESGGYQYSGDCDFNDAYQRGIEDLRAVLRKLKDAGIMPGIHFLQTHIGIRSRYVTPIADHRLNLTRYFTLARSLGTDDTTIYVEQNPEGTVLDPRCRVLKFDGELISYESYTTEYPYCFKGCVRGHFNTNIMSHSLGTIGGILDISEFGATSVYIDQRTSLQDEIAEKLAEVYNAGFEFIYYDGSEGTNPPFEFNVPYAQYRVYRKLDKKPLFCEGAAKAHFSWHMLSGGNAFDVFPTDVFKEKIAQFPLEEASRMANDFTRLNFGWWAYRNDTQPDIYEYGTSKAAAWNCPATMMSDIGAFQSNARTDDVFDVIGRWEDVRKSGWLTSEMKEMLKDPDQEYILLINEDGCYELCPYYCIEQAAGGNNLVSAFWFERRGRSWVVCWHTSGSGKLRIPLISDDISYEKKLGGNKLDFEKDDKGIIIQLSGRKYLSSAVAKDELIRAFENAVLID